MCGRFVQASAPRSLALVEGVQLPDSRLSNWPPRYNGAPSQDFLVGRRNYKTGETTLDLIRWGLIPSWAKDRKIAWKMINARSETVATATAFKGAFASAGWTDELGIALSVLAALLACDARYW